MRKCHLPMPLSPGLGIIYSNWGINKDYSVKYLLK
jgi:hypothetical protein